MPTILMNENTTIGDVAEYFQELINEGKFQMLPFHQQEMIFELNSKHICSLLGDIKPEEARYRAENPEEFAHLKFGEDENVNLYKIDNSNNNKRSFSGRIFPPLSIRNRFK